MATASKSSALLAEMRVFVENHANTPSPELLPAAVAAGYQKRLEEISAEGQPDGTVIVRFKVYVGRDDAFELFDTLTVKVGTGSGPVSVVARKLANDSLTNLFFDRWPEQVAPPVSTQTVDVGQQPAGDIVLPEEDSEEQEYVEESAPISRRAAAEAAKMPSLIDHLEPDGVPVFIDFDNIPDQFSTAEIIAQFLVDVDAAAVKFSSAEQVLALFTKNAEAVDFLKELGGPDDRTALKGLLDKHQARLEAAGVVREVKIPGGKGSTVARRRRAA